MRLVSQLLGSSLTLFAAVIAAAASVSPQLQVTQAWARATPPGAQIGAAYVVIANPGNTADRLLAVESATCRRVEIHNTKHHDGRMQMRPLERLDVPAGGRIAFEPGNLHLMLVDLKETLRVGEQLPLTFVFEKAGRISIQAPVAPIGAMHGPGKAGHGDQH